MNQYTIVFLVGFFLSIWYFIQILIQLLSLKNNNWCTQSPPVEGSQVSYGVDMCIIPISHLVILGVIILLCGYQLIPFFQVLFGYSRDFGVDTNFYD